MPAPGVDAYRCQQLESMTPGQLVLVAYEQGILACRNQDRRRARRVIEHLIAALDFEQGGVADGLLLLYDWGLRLIQESKFQEAEDILEELRAAWVSAMATEKERAERSDSALPPRSGLPSDLTC
ncbi:MAG: flagellar protein FliS [Candidatus Eisenbacteria sp.]|nr:flagellar protein FliS [Candidatus Eisenbacteria bacterium]